MNVFYKSARFLGIALMACLLLALSACSGEDVPAKKGGQSQEPVQTKAQAAVQPTPAGGKTPKDQAGAIDNSKAQLTPMIQEYDNGNIVEILAISYDGGQPALEQYGWKNPEIESFNLTVRSGIQQQYFDFTDQNNGESRMEIRSYPFTDERYLQVVTTAAVYPSYGTDGELYSYNFDKQVNRFLSINDALEEMGITEDTAAQSIREKADALLAQQSGMTAGDVTLNGFLYVSSPDGRLTQFLASVDVVTDGDAWKTFFAYTPDLDELIQLNSQCLFDPSEMDQMDPPLSYQQQPEMPGEELALIFDTDGLDVLAPGQEYMLDGLVYFKTDKTDAAQYSEDAVLASIEAMQGQPLRLISIEESPEHAQALTYPSWLVSYETGENEDTAYCRDLYVQTDSGDYRLHTSTPIDYWDQYQDEITYRLSFVSLGE